MKTMVLGMMVSILLLMAGFRNLLLIAKKGGADPIECQLTVLAPVVSGALLYFFFASQIEKFFDLNLDYPKRRGLL